MLDSENVQFLQVDYGTLAYDTLVQLRHQILRKPLGMEFTAEQLAQEAHYFHFALMENETPVACLILVPHEAGRIQMKQVAVSAEMQGKGLGARLTREAESWAKHRGYSYVYCHARDIAVPFYERQGYIADGEPFVEVGIPHRYMYKNI